MNIKFKWKVSKKGHLRQQWKIKKTKDFTKGKLCKKSKIVKCKKKNNPD
jgi:hypothetical protein